MIRGIAECEDAYVPASVQAAVATVRAQGLRVSSARRLVLEALFAAGGPVTAEDVASGLDGRVPPSDLGSVYRNLETLERLGVVRHLRAAHGAGLYAINRGEGEGFLACERCGEIRPANPHAVAVISGAVRKAFGYEASFGSFPIVGVCPRCSEGDAA
jgi:Fur family transcriptional regulator, ferric uptake regulator